MRTDAGREADIVWNRSRCRTTAEVVFKVRVSGNRARGRFTTGASVETGPSRVAGIHRSDRPEANSGSQVRGKLPSSSALPADATAALHSKTDFTPVAWNACTENGFLSISRKEIREKTMTNFKLLAALAILSTAIASPAFAAGDEGGGTLTPQRSATAHHVRAHHHSFRGAYNRYDLAFRRTSRTSDLAAGIDRGSAANPRRLIRHLSC